MATRARSGPDWRRIWLTPIAVLVVVALVVFAGFYLLDHIVTGGDMLQSPDSALSRYVHFDADHITDAVSALAGMIAAVLGIVITVVSIIVQLSADRYTGVAQMFLRDRINIGVMAFFVIACVCGVWLSMSLQHGFVPRATLLALMGATSLGLVMMLPYFAYVFWFLEPKNIIERLRRDALRTVATGSRAKTDGTLLASQQLTITAMEELSDITSNSISGKDKIIASRAVDALKDFALEYMNTKASAVDPWFKIGEEIKDNPDFVAMDPESLSDLEDRRTWVEWKILRQYLGIYNEALAAMPDINYLIAIDTRYIGEGAAVHGDREAINLVFRFLNSYLRGTLNARNVRTAYNVLNQYRLFVEALLRLGLGSAVLEGVKHMKYYGHVSFNMNLAFVAETVAYDIAALCSYAHRTAPGEQQDEMLAMFLELDQPLGQESEERGLLGVRKAQAKLAAYYLAAGEDDKARLIAEDMRDEPAERLQTIRDALERVKSKDFWEIIDRGRNFEYMPPAQREKLGEFFGWLTE